jgi:PhnB protein
MDFYRRAFGAIELYRSELPGGGGLHIHLQVADTLVMLTDEMTAPENDESINSQIVLRAPQSLGGNSVLLQLTVEDADQAYQRALDAGATPTLPLSNTFWGDRYGWVTDPLGHIWGISAPLEELTPEQVQERMMALGRGQTGAEGI